MNKYYVDKDALLGPVDPNIKFGRADHWNTESEADHQEAEDAYLNYIASLPRYPISGEHGWKDGDVVKEGDGFDLHLKDNGSWQGEWVAIPVKGKDEKDLKAWIEVVGIVQRDQGEVAFMDTAEELFKKYGPLTSK